MTYFQFKVHRGHQWVKQKTKIIAIMAQKSKCTIKLTRSDVSSTLSVHTSEIVRCSVCCVLCKDYWTDIKFILNWKLKCVNIKVYVLQVKLLHMLITYIFICINQSWICAMYNSYSFQHIYLGKINTDRCRWIKTTTNQRTFSLHEMMFIHSKMHF